MAVFGAKLRVTWCVVSLPGRSHSRFPKLRSRPLLLSNMLFRQSLAVNVLLILCKPLPTSTLAPQCCPFGAFDLISRGAMLDGLRSVAGADSILPFVLQFCGNPSSCLWDDDAGETHEIRQGEGGEQGDPPMPMLCALRQHQTLRSVASVHTRDSWLSTMMWTPLHSQSGLWRSTGFWARSCGSTAAFGSMLARPRSGVGVTMSPACETLLNEARATNPRAQVSRKNVASEFWALLWAQKSSSGRSWRPPRPLSKCCSNAPLQCRTCSQRGFSCCSALHHGQHFTCGCVILTTLRHSRDSMTFTSGSVSPTALRSLTGSGQSSVPHGGLGFRTPFSTCRHLGRMGRLPAHHQPTS